MLSAFVSACAPTPGAPARLLVGANDTLVVSNRKPVHIPIRALDATGRETPMSGVRFQWISGDSLTLTATGNITCSRNADGTVRASLNALSIDLLLRCRPVQRLQLSGPMQLVVGDSSQRIPVVAIGLDDKPVDMFAGSVKTRVDSVIDIEPGLRLRARVAGGSLTTVYVGDVHASVGVHTYNRVNTLDGLRAEHQPAVILPLRLEGGEVRRWKLPPGGWMLAMLPYEDEHGGLRLRIEGARCMPMRLTPRRVGCEATGNAYLIISHPSPKPAAAISGEIQLDPDRN